MIGSTFHTALPPQTYCGIDNIAETSQQRTEFLSKLGYTVTESEECEQIRIPMEFSEVYIRYNELQKRMGTDLLDYRGADCLRFTYHEADSSRLIGLIVYENRVIGGEVYTTAINGYMDNL